MDKDEQVRQIKKLLHRLDSGTNVDAGELFENPTNTYVDPILAEQEREVFFKKTPQLVGLSGDLPQFTIKESDGAGGWSYVLAVDVAGGNLFDHLC